MTSYQEQRYLVLHITKAIREAGELMIKARMMALTASHSKIHTEEMADIRSLLANLQEQTNSTASNLKTWIPSI